MTSSYSHIGNYQIGKYIFIKIIILIFYLFRYSVQKLSYHIHICPGKLVKNQSIYKTALCFFHIEEFIYIFLVVFQDIVSYVGFFIIMIIILKLYAIFFYFFFYFTYIIFYSSPAYIQFIGHTGKIYFFIKQNS